MKAKKNSGADLESKRPIFMEAGLIIALALSLLAFNWKSFDKIALPDYSRMLEDIPEEMVQITQQKPPELPKVNIPPVMANISIVEDGDAVDDDFIFSAEIDPMDEVEAYVPPVRHMVEEAAVEEEEIFTVVESYPEFPGGEAALYNFLGKNLRYPDMAKETGISGKVYVTFIVEKDGSITDVKLARGIGGGCDEEALRVVNLMPKWTPGKQRGIPVRVRYIFSVRFTLELS
jgi:protein TonB